MTPVVVLNPDEESAQNYNRGLSKMQSGKSMCGFYKRRK